MTDDLVRTAYHEASHAVMSLSLGRPVEAISIRPGLTFDGVTHFKPRPIPDAGKVGMSIPRLPARLRRDVEGRVLVLLAGGLGALLAAGSGFVADDHQARALEALDALREPPDLTPAMAERVAAAERDPNPTARDELQAIDAARLLASSDDQAHTYLRWLASVARDYVGHPDFLREVELIVPELLRRGVISGRRARQILKEGAPA